MTVIRQYNEKDREQIIELWKTCDLIRTWNAPNKILIGKRGLVMVCLRHKVQLVREIVADKKHGI